MPARSREADVASVVPTVKSVHLDGRPVPVALDDATHDRPGGSGAGRVARFDVRRPTDPLVRPVDEPGRDDSPVRVREPFGDGRPARVADVDDGRAAIGRPPEPGDERIDHRCLVGEHVWMVPLRPGQDRDIRLVGIEVAGVLVRLDDEGRACAPARGRREAAGELAREQRPDEGRRIQPGCGEHVDEPSRRGALAVGPGYPNERPPDRGIRDDLLPGFEIDPGRPRRPQLWVIGVDRGQRLGDGDAVGARRAGDVAGVVLPSERYPGIDQRRSVWRGAAGVAT